MRSSDMAAMLLRRGLVVVEAAGRGGSRGQMYDMATDEPLGCMT
jgi:hypothetical protein